MPTIEDLFILHNARGSGFSRHKAGDVAYVSNGARSNGVMGYVTPRTGDRVFKFVGVVLSTFCEATVQAPPFMARGNGGSGLIALEPRTKLNADQLAYLAAFINTSVRWRFNWYRQATIDRVRRLEIPRPTNPPTTFRVKQFLTMDSVATNGHSGRIAFKAFPLESIYEMQAGDYHSATELDAGDTPLVSCGDFENGIMAFVDVPADRVYDHRLTIAFNDMNTMTAKYHPYKFAAKDDVAVCTPRQPLRRSTEVFIQVMLQRERWRYSFYRKCFMAKLRRQSVSLPAKRNEIDEDTIAALVEATPYWGFLKTNLA